MTTQITGWTPQLFEQFWTNPDPALVPAMLTDDIVGHWTGVDEPVRGKDAYTACIAALVAALPGLYLTVAEHAGDGEFTFVRWIMHATGNNGPFEISGIDRIRLRDGLVAENVVVFDSAAFEARAGMPVPWV